MRSPDQVLTAAQMRAAEETLVSRGTTIDALMLRAGEGAADWIWRAAMGRDVTVLCGPGNNGGDGYVIARVLQDRGLAVRVVAPLPPATDAARAARDAWAGGAETGGAETGGASVRGGVFVDCLFGTGLTRPLSADHAGLIAALGQSHAFAVAVDVPSGVATDDGALLGDLPSFDMTLALGAWKPAHFLMPAMARMGALRLVDIGLDRVEDAACLYPRPHLAAPATEAHKYARGLVGVVGGPMPGAALLAAQAAMRAGAGYVKLLADQPHPAGPAALVVDGRPLPNALEDPRWSALLVGPGLDRDDRARDRLRHVLDRAVPCVLDADALHLLDPDMLEGVDTARLLLTPHEGELGQLCAAFGIAGTAKVDRARGLAAVTGLTVLAKGPDTILAAGDGRLAFFDRASSWLSTAGTGDVLGGVAASRLATREDCFAAAGEAVWLHSEAARRAGAAFTADDLAACVSGAYAHFL
ncbi:NAD(P)H-hydrate epimerase [Altererythrobacter aerius]|uniref:Bifunctional NAD(P)H-hydrate repair enzyme n=1 Tax=Tsuneonella aeria TaxID=1837929 RepID=A0A6I4TBX8_9SPHN|nr:NAD(P)H-hydrate epimerase [Tsuneonella aeria]MXO74167.1 NAD(P)H-hydrate epimerase [Tsuneonella aeria]